MEFGFVRGRLVTLFLAYLVVQVVSDDAIPGSCPLVDSMSCGTTTLENGEVYDMVPKLITDENIYLPDIPELENIVTHRLICKVPACISNPCLNGGTCLETIHGFDCSCTPEFYGPTCASEFCRKPWLFFGGSCYQVFPEGVTFDQALMNCRNIELEMGQVDLASIHSGQENDFILSLCQVTQIETCNRHWIGLYQPNPNVEGAFVWSDGTPLGYTDWLPNQPNDWRNNEDCGRFRLISGVVGWNDDDCSRVFSYICKVTFNI